MDILIDEADVKNNRYLNYVERKKERKSNYSTTLSDFHQYNIDALKNERQNMLEAYEVDMKALMMKLGQEKELLQSHTDELTLMNDLKILKKNQEMQIELLETDGRALRVQLSEKLTEIKTQLQEERKQLNEQTQNEFYEARTRSQKVFRVLFLVSSI
ncbi:hypothetical protein EG68_12016 [Paragonimus skrjabini miyazakii]|uniref:DUF4515 domain-containing protein n=1 Tax=Paragonimus skrjabini miyazakii TaxID=59628 RepID=A0A8S9YCF2_9TREM|nr:hypothetical protein EG68_12016 [Paragonimus skrjabini miyazakii]